MHYSCHAPPPLVVLPTKIATHQNDQNFDPSHENELFVATDTEFSLFKNGGEIQEAIAYIETHPESKVTTVAKEFGITCAKLRGRLDGRQPKKGQPASEY